MTKQATRRRHQHYVRLLRTADTYEFLVREPWGASAISGYRKAARHFGLHTMEDPSMEGSDGYRVFIDKSAPALRQAAKVLDRAYESQEQSAIDDAEMWLLDSHVSWFAHDWQYWDEAQDKGALECLGWKRTIVEAGRGYRVTLKPVTRRRERREA